MPPTPGVSFLAMTLGEALAIPPDTMGSVGPDQILVHTNGRVRLFDKTGAPAPAGTPLNVTANAFWASVRDGKGVSDPHVEYDRLSQRWFLTIINVPRDGSGNPFGPNRVLVAVSDGPTIADGTSFTFFEFQVDGPPPGTDTNRFGDYPTLGVDANAVYIGINMFDQAATLFQNTTAFVIDKADLLASTLTVTAFRNLIDTTLDGPYTPQAVHNQDPGATDGYLIGVDFGSFGELDLLRVTDPGGTPALVQVDVPVPATSFPMFGVPQPSPGPLLDDIDDRLFAAMIARNPAGQVRLWTAHNIEVNTSGNASSVGNRDGSRWYEIGTLTGTPTVVQSGTLFDPAVSEPHSYWMPSIAANGQGHAVIGASRAGANGTTGFAGAAVAERLASDPAGTLSAPLDVQSSTFLYDVGTQTRRRWGDYSQTVIDPNDNMTFWTFQEYTNATNSWGVRVIELKAPPPATPSSASPRNLTAGTSVSVDITDSVLDGSGFFDPGPDTGGPGFANRLEASVDGGVVVNDVTFTDPTHITLDLDTALADGFIKTLTVVNPDGQEIDACGLFGVGNEGDTTPPEVFGLVSPDDDATVGATPTLFWEPASDADCEVAKYQLFIDDALNRDDIDAAATSTTPAAPLLPGTYDWKVRALDDAGNFRDSEERSFTVANLPPALAPIGNKTATEGQPLSFQVSATDADGDALTYSASNLPSGASFSPATRTFSWTPGFTQAGVYPGVHFEVSDGVATDAEDVQITVSEGTLGPKQVALRAKPKKVEKGKKVKIRARVSPCEGHEGDLIRLVRGSKRIATKATNDACVARFRLKMKRTVRFRAVSPQQDDDHLAGRSKKVKVRVV
ncbi:MAG: Ig domain-containing protein [Actinomycetota bacterium]